MPSKRRSAIYEKAGATIKEVSLPHSKYGIPAYYIVAPAECSSNLARYDGTTYGHRAADFSPKYPGEENLPAMIRMMMASRDEGFGAEVKRRIMLGTFALSAGYADQYYNKALQVGARSGVTSTRPSKKLTFFWVRPRRRRRSSWASGRQTRLRCIFRIFIRSRRTWPVFPGSRSRAGLTRDKLPIGLQLLAAPFAEETLLRTARVFERETDWHLKRPGLT